MMRPEPARPDRTGAGDDTHALALRNDRMHLHAGPDLGAGVARQLQECLDAGLGRDNLSPLLNDLWLAPTLLAAWCVA